MEDVQEYYNRQVSKNTYCTENELFERVEQPIFDSLKNNLYRTLIEGGADVNATYRGNYVRDKIEKLIDDNKANIKRYKEELKHLIEEKKQTPNEIRVTKIFQYLNEIIEKEKEDVKGSYREYALNNHTTNDFYDLFYKTYPALYLTNSFQNRCDKKGKNNLEENYTKLIELEISKLNYNEECLEYFINHGAKSSKEVILKNNLKMPKKLMKEYQEQLNAIKILLEEKAEVLAAEEKESYLKEEILLQQAINKQQEEIDEIYKVYQESIQPEPSNNEESKQNSTLELPLPENIFSEPINFDELMKFTYLEDDSIYYKNVVPAKLIQEYMELFQAIYVNDITKVEKMAQNLVFAVHDKFGMTPFMWACLRGHNKLAVRILDTVSSQYVPKKKINLEEDEQNKSINAINAINNNDIIGR